MSRFTRVAAVALLVGGLAGQATAGRAGRADNHLHAKNLNVLLYIDGSLGDLGFFDSAYAGVMRAKQSLGATVKVVQNADSTQWQSQLLALAGSHRYDLMIVTTDDPSMVTATKALIAKYPQQRIVDFDDTTYAASPSVSTISYKQNEGSFLAGALAAIVADSNLPYVSHQKVLGMVGGLKIPVILDFQVGYVQGAKSIDPAIAVRVTFIGGSGSNDTWNNAPAGARQAGALYAAGASVVYQVAGGSGLGVLAQAKAKNRYAIGVDSNQDLVSPGHVIGSVVKRVDNSLFDMIQLDMNGKLQGAHTYFYGLQNHGVDLTRDAETRAIITPPMYKQLDALEAQVMSGKIKVQTALK